jgi:hypothetical protein
MVRLRLELNLGVRVRIRVGEDLDFIYFRDPNITLKKKGFRVKDRLGLG